MSHVELLEAEGSVWGLVGVIVALTLICALTVAIIPWLRDQHAAGVERVRADTGGKLRPSDRVRWLMRDVDEHELDDDDERGATAWQPSAEQ